MATWMRQLLSYRRFFILVATPLLLLPLPLVVRSKEASCAYTIILMAVFWCTEVIPLAVTALLPVLFFPMFAILDSKQVCMQYLKDTNMLFVGGLIVATAVEHWNLHKRIALKVLLIVGVRPPLLMLGFMGVTAFLSMWISNTATTAMMVPIVQAVLSQLSNTEYESSILDSDGQINPAMQLDEKNAIPMTEVAIRSPVVLNGHTQEICSDGKDKKEKKLINKGMMLCVCYAASIGGTATLTGTGPNLVLKGQLGSIFPNNGDVVNFASWFGFAFPNMMVMLMMAWLWLQFSFMGLNFKKTWGCGTKGTEKERSAYNVIRDEYRKLGPISFAEFNVLLLFSLLVILWFTRDPGFVRGWATIYFNKDKEYVTDATVAIFVAILLFVLPAERPRFTCCKQSNSFDVEDLENGCRTFFMAWSADGISERHSALGHCHHLVPNDRCLYRMCQQCCYGDSLLANPSIYGKNHSGQSTVYYDSLYPQHLLCLHVTCCHTSKRHRLLIWSSPCVRYGENRDYDEHHWRAVHYNRYQQLGQGHV
ncbi:Na(+)/citrate cotransporter-like isoform X3 [Hyperolius riggenbachi]|uniref:Na(+)/citrate cotransporter-like isoform X3 n=1 Tax=Hyperolius riggenbachi TaxID=752182 RepID=UPI0035A28101